MSFTPYLFVGVGETNAFFTLRETYMHEHWVGGQGGYMHKEVRSFHHFNLSQNAFEAFEKAKKLSQEMCLELKTSLEELDQQMREIKKATAQQMEERQARFKAHQEQWEAERLAAKVERLEKIASGYFVFGPYAGKKFSEAARGYLTWLMDNVGSFDEDSILQITARAVSEQVPELALPKPDKDLLVGEPKQRLTFKVTVIGSRYFVRTSYNGYSEEVVWVTTMVSEEGACLVCFSGSFHPKEGEEIKIKATVKSHGDYKGQSQTIVQRVAVL